MSEPKAKAVVGRYVLHAPIARGGMATIHLARLLGAEGFCRTVAAKRLHPQFTDDAEFLKMFLDEARIASKVHHPNVVPVLDVVQAGDEVILVQEYVHGVPLDKLLRAMSQQKKLLPVPVVTAIVGGMLAGLSAAHEARDELGAPLGIVHRDVSPQNLLIGVDGMARLIDFGVAKAALNLHVTRAGVFKGKLAYSSPEALQGEVTRAGDIYAAAVVLWETLAARRLHTSRVEAELIAAITAGAREKLTDAIDREGVSRERWELLVKLEPVVSRAMAFDPKDRYATAAEMLAALIEAAPPAGPEEVARWVRLLGKEYLEGRERVIASEESSFRRQRPEAPPEPVAAPVEPPYEPSHETTASNGSEAAESLRGSVFPVTQVRSRSHWPVVAALLLIGGLLTGIFVLLLRRPIDVASLAAPGPRTALAISTPETAAAPVEAVVPVIDAGNSEPALSAPSAAVSAEVPSRPPRAVAAPPMARARVTPQEPAAAPASTPAVNCNPPFYFDGKKKIFKPGCL